MKKFTEWLNQRDPEYLIAFNILEQTDENVFTGLKQIMRNGQLVWVVPKANVALDAQGNVTKPNDAYYVPANHPNAEYTVTTLRSLKKENMPMPLGKTPSIGMQPTEKTVPVNIGKTPSQPIAKTQTKQKTIGAKEWTPITLGWMPNEDVEKSKILPGSPEWKQYEIYLRKLFMEIFGNDARKWHPFARQAVGIDPMDPRDAHNVYYFVFYSTMKGPNFNNWSENQRIKAGISLERETFQQNKIQQLTNANGEQWKKWRIARIWAGLEPAKDEIEGERAEWFGIYIDGKGYDVSQWTTNERNTCGIP